MLKALAIFTIETSCDGKKETIEMYSDHLYQTLSDISKEVPYWDLRIVGSKVNPITDGIRKVKSSEVGLIWFCRSSTDTLEAILDNWNKVETMCEYTHYLINLEN